MYSKTKIMDLQTDIQWIISELSKVRDPELINAFKSMLKYRQKHQTSTDWWDEVSEEESLDELVYGQQKEKARNCITENELFNKNTRAF